MMAMIFGRWLSTIICFVLCWSVCWTQFEWQSRDYFDVISDQIKRVNKDNCKIVDINELFLPNSTVTHVPNIKSLGIDPVFPNRTNLLHVHNMAMRSAFFYSFILQRANDSAEPGFVYYFLSTIADVAANRFINASAIVYAPHKAYTPSYLQFFNKTLGLFGPRAYRADDFDDPHHISKVSTLNTFEATDLGAIKLNSRKDNYTHETYKINPWYYHWLPDDTQRQDSKTTYTVKISHANGVNETITFHGPPHASDDPGPVKWTQPYFDCGRSNKWIVAATSPVVDLNPRHTGWRHIEYPRYVAASVIEIDFERLDINQCPFSEGNPRPNAFAGTARCRNETTECEPIYGFGFRRGGYQCRCRTGFRLPKTVRTPFLGQLIERATTREYQKGFSCEKIGYMAVKTQNARVMSEFERYKMVGSLRTATGLGKNSTLRLEPNSFADFLRHNITPDSCAYVKRLSPQLLHLRGDIAHGKEKQFENEARMALRLANFISAFMQVVNPEERYAEFRVPDSPLTKDQIIGEILSIVVSNLKILGATAMFDRNQFPDKKNPYFAPYAFKTRRELRTFYVRDMAMLAPGKKVPDYIDDGAFDFLKKRWDGITGQLQTYTSKINIRFNSSGLNTIKYDQYPQQYRAAEFNDGYWSTPFYDCGGLDRWILSYSAPFFGWNNLRDRLVYKGAITVKIDLLQMDMNQCDESESANNAFKGTHKCDRESSRCVPMHGRKFESGGYKCECNQGYEYPYQDPVTYIDGQSLESEYQRMEQRRESRFDQLKCRIAGSATLYHNFQLIFFSLLTSFFILRKFL